MIYKLCAIKEGVPDFRCKEKEYRWIMLNLKLGKVIGLRRHENSESYYWPWGGLDPMKHEGYWICDEDCKYMLQLVQSINKKDLTQDKEQLLNDFEDFLKDCGGFEVF